MIYSFPLNWPPGWDRTGSPGNGGFKVDLQTAERELAEELEKLEAEVIKFLAEVDADIEFVEDYHAN